MLFFKGTVVRTSSPANFMRAETKKKFTSPLKSVLKMSPDRIPLPLIIISII
jgi:hypothetical protein